MVIALSAADHTYVGVRAYCFLKPAVLLKPNKHKKKKVFLRDFFVRSGNLENNHSAESLRVDVPAAPRRFGNVWTLAGSTIATFALLLRCGSEAAAPAGLRAEQYSSRWKDGKKRGAWGSRCVCSQMAMGPPPRTRTCSPFGSQRCIFI